MSFVYTLPAQGCCSLRTSLCAATSARLRGGNQQKKLPKLFWRSYPGARLLKSIGRSGVPPCLKKKRFGLLQLLRGCKTCPKWTSAWNPMQITKPFSRLPPQEPTQIRRERFCDSDVLSGLGRGIGIRRRSCTGKRIAEHRQTNLVQWGMWHSRLVNLIESSVKST